MHPLRRLGSHAFLSLEVRSDLCAAKKSITAKKEELSKEWRHSLLTGARHAPAPFAGIAGVL